MKELNPPTQKAYKIYSIYDRDTEIAEADRCPERVLNIHYKLKKLSKKILCT